MTEAPTNAIIVPLPRSNECLHDDSFLLQLEEVNPRLMDKVLAPGLHIVATPIGNLGDLSPRAADVLRHAHRILAEDTRVTAKLLAHIGAKVPMTLYDDHSSEAERDRIVARLGELAIALVGTA